MKTQLKCVFMKVPYFSEFFTYFFKVLPINAFQEVYVKLACVLMYHMNLLSG